MEAKRQATHDAYLTAEAKSSDLVDPETRAKLATVGPRARKIVSDGHLTPGTTIPSYLGLTTGSLDQQQIKQQYFNDLRAHHSNTYDETVYKRMRPQNDDDEDGDTDDDMDAGAGVDYDKKMYIRPSSHRSLSQHTEDFGEADFLNSNNA